MTALYVGLEGGVIDVVWFRLWGKGRTGEDGHIGVFARVNAIGDALILKKNEKRVERSGDRWLSNSVWLPTASLASNSKEENIG